MGGGGGGGGGGGKKKGGGGGGGGGQEKLGVNKVGESTSFVLQMVQPQFRCVVTLLRSAC